MQSPKQQTGSAELRTVQVVEGDEHTVAAVTAALRRAGCALESVVQLAPGMWQVTARSHD